MSGLETGAIEMLCLRQLWLFSEKGSSFLGLLFELKVRPHRIAFFAAAGHSTDLLAGPSLRFVRRHVRLSALNAYRPRLF